MIEELNRIMGMGKLLFMAGLILGWLISAIVPAPQWLNQRVQGIFHAGSGRAGAAAKNKSGDIKSRLRRTIEKNAESLEKRLE